MLISKFDLYKSEWLELVFENRNKNYGAYQLRQHHNRTMILAMTFTFLGVGVLFGTSAILQSHHHTAPPPVITIVDLSHFKDQQAKKLPPPVIPHTPPPPHVATVRFVPPVVRQDNLVTEQPPKIEGLTEAISTENSKGVHGDAPPVIDVAPGNGPSVTEDDDKVHTLVEVQVMPTPMGGEDAWNKFLSKNLRYPSEAQDAGVGGKVYMSFVVEKDGSLSNFTVERGAGYGMDEEATRVLKLAKAWKPGLQNGRPVRVKFVIPINFQFGGEN
jgi:protein TonB